MERREPSASSAPLCRVEFSPREVRRKRELARRLTVGKTRVAVRRRRAKQSAATDPIKKSMSVANTLEGIWGQEVAANED